MPTWCGGFPATKRQKTSPPRSLPALKKLDNYEWRGTPFMAWLYRIAANALADRWERRSKEGAAPSREIPEAAAMDDIERRAALFQLVDALPADQRQVVVLRFVEQKSIRDISQEMKKTEGAVKQLHIPRTEAASLPDGGCECLSALWQNSSIRRYRRCWIIPARRLRKLIRRSARCCALRRSCATCRGTSSRRGSSMICKGNAACLCRGRQRQGQQGVQRPRLTSPYRTPQPPWISTNGRLGPRKYAAARPRRKGHTRGNSDWQYTDPAVR